MQILEDSKIYKKNTLDRLESINMSLNLLVNTGNLLYNKIEEQISDGTDEQYYELGLLQAEIETIVGSIEDMQTNHIYLKKDLKVK